uniref:HAT C-terminal dimerisation domain-containing protein n=1 Tax=Trichuris muris TaxID=70415 RepID=A0A5S6R4E1_TRIMR
MFNEIHKQLLIEDLYLIKTTPVISAFMSKLLLFKQRFAMGELCQFQNFIKVKKDGHVSVRRFEDILSMAIPNWVINPYTNVEDEEISLQIELLDLQSNAELKPRLAEGYQRFWLQKQIPDLYPNVWAVVKRWLICFPSSSLVERAFSVVTDLMTKKRKGLQLVKRGDLRLRVTSMLPNIDKLVCSQLSQPSTSR